MTKQQIENVLENVKLTFLNIPYKFTVTEKGDGFLIKLSMKLPCTSDPTSEPTWQHGGKNYISSHSIDNEVVLKAWKAYKDFMIHELHESFLYQQIALFNPHIPIDVLSEFVKSVGLVHRESVITNKDELETINV